MSKRSASQEIDHDPTVAKKFSHLEITSRASLSSVQNFALSILENRNLAQYVRRVTLTYSYGAYRPAQALPYTASTAEEQAKEKTFKAAIAEQKWEEPEATELLKRLMTTEWQGFRKPSSHQLLPDAVVALLLPILPNVECWVVGEIDRPYFVGKAVQRAKDGIFGSISVTRLEIRPNAPFSAAAWDGISWQAFKIYASLPCLQSMSSKGVGGIGIEDGGGYEEIPSKVSAVREIHLKHCEISGTCVSNIINFSTGLEAFSYQFGGRAGDGGIVGWCSPQVAKALTLHRMSMRKLDLDVDNQIHGSLANEIHYWIEGMEADEEIRKRVGAIKADKELKERIEGSGERDSDTETLDSTDSTRNVEEWEEETKSDPYFPNLTHLRIGIKAASRFAELSGKTLAEWFPATLEELEIVGYRHSETGEMAEAVLRREEILPNLKVLKGIEEYIENGKELRCEDDYVASAGSDDDLVEDTSDSN